MIAISANDSLELLNGPEDGSEFTIAEKSVDIGSGRDCAVQIRFDELIHPAHARLSAVAGGYRVRVLDGGRVLVNGKKAGRIRSRHCCDGDVLVVGNSEFYLHCAPEGIAARSNAMPLESDLIWLLRLVVAKSYFFVRVLWRGVRRLLGPLFWPLAALAALCIAVRWLLPGITGWLWYHLLYWGGWAYYTIWSLLT